MSDRTDPGPETPAQPPASLEAIAAELERERERAREIDHRARNSLQLAGALMQLVARRSEAPETQRVLRALQQRVGAIAAVHRGFIDSPDPRRFDLTPFLREQMTGLARTAPPGTELRLDLDPVEIASSEAAPLALIANELACNALAYAGAAPRVHVVLQRLGEGWRLSVEDGGPGLPDPSAAPGLGLTIVRLMSQQLRAQLDFEDAQPGLRAVVTKA
jgi:two-component sensor histidine kinase